MQFLYSSFISIFLTAVCAAQQSATLRVIPIGQHVPTVLEAAGRDANGNRLVKEKDVDPRFLGPSELIVVGKKMLVPTGETDPATGSAVTKKVPASIRLSLNSRSQPYAYNPRKGLQLASSISGVSQQFGLPAMPAESSPTSQQPLSTLVVLFQDLKKKTWVGYKRLILQDDWKHFSQRKVRIANVSGQDIVFKLPNADETLKPGEVKMLPIKLSAGSKAEHLPYLVFAKVGKERPGFELMRRGMLLPQDGKRSTLYIYQNRTNARQKPVLIYQDDEYKR